MKIPKIISRYGSEYIFVEKYPNFYLYKNMLTGCKQCFYENELRNNVNKSKNKKKEKYWKDV